MAHELNVKNGLKFNDSEALTSIQTIVRDSGLASDSSLATEKAVRDVITSLNVSGTNTGDETQSTILSKLGSSGVVAGSYTNVNVTVDSYGRVTTISSGPALSLTATVGSDLLANHPVAILENGTAVPADVSNGRAAVGFVLQDYSQGNSATIYLAGLVMGNNSLIPGTYVYLATSGAITQSPVSTTGFIVQMLGTAVSTSSYTWSPQIIAQC